jgi:hypothetical protein
MEESSDNNRTPQNSTYHNDVSWSGVVALFLFFTFILALVKIIVGK